MVAARERLRCGYPHADPLRCLALILLIPLLESTLLMAPGFGQQVLGTEAHLRDLTLTAKAAQERRDYRSAAAAYEEILRLRPELAEGWANLGLMHEFMENYPQADHDFQVALSRDSQLYVPNLFLGLNLLRSHQPREAIRYLKRAQNLNPR